MQTATNIATTSKTTNPASEAGKTTTSEVLKSLASPIRVLRKSEIMYEDRGWTRGYVTLAFDDVPKNAPGFLEYGSLKLAADGVIDVGAGYPMHPHAEVETITIMISGSLAHDDTLLGAEITGPNDIAVLSAGTGMQHAEMVHGDVPARAMLFWLRSDPAGQPPRFVRRTLDRAERRNRFATLASGRPAPADTKAQARRANDDDNAPHIRSNSSILAAVLDPGAMVAHEIEAGRCAYVLSTDGPIEVNGVRVEAADRVLASTGMLEIRSLDMVTEVFLVDLVS